jgi:hypothetical protein
MSAEVSAIDILVGPLIITIIDPRLCRSIIDGNRSCCGLNLGGCPLLCLTVIIRVIKDDYLTVTRRPEDVAVEIAKKLSGDFLITRSINNKRGRVKHWALPRGIALLEHQ